MCQSQKVWLRIWKLSIHTHQVDQFKLQKPLKFVLLLYFFIPPANRFILLYTLKQAFSQRGIRVSFGHPIADFERVPKYPYMYFMCVMQWDEKELDTQSPNSPQMCIFGHPILISWLKPCFEACIRPCAYFTLYLYYSVQSMSLCLFFYKIHLVYILVWIVSAMKISFHSKISSHVLSPTEADEEQVYTHIVVNGISQDISCSEHQILHVSHSLLSSCFFYSFYISLVLCGRSFRHSRKKVRLDHTIVIVICGRGQHLTGKICISHQIIKSCTCTLALLTYYRPVSRILKICLLHC